MIYFLYNPLSMGGKGEKLCQKLLAKAKKKGKECEIRSLLDLKEDVQGFVDSLTSDDRILLIGGDGTLHNVVNSVDFSQVKCPVYFYRGGSGNDFARGHKGKCFEIGHELKDLPMYDDGVNKPTKFINGVGIGIDADVCFDVNAHNKSESYFKSALRVFKTYKPYSLDIVIDGKEIHYDNVFFFTAMNGKYMGGGMKIAPKAVRNDEWLDLYIITSPKKSKILRVFPLIFAGWHGIAKKLVHYVRAKEIEAKISTPKALQSDGEVTENIQSIVIKRHF